MNADIVYVGYGIQAPEYQWDDYKGVDVKGKVLLMLVNEPPSDDPKFFKGKALTYYGRWVYKYEEAARKGAVGAILIHKTDMASYPWDVVRNSDSGEKSYLKLDGSPKLQVASWIHLDAARGLAAMAGLDLDKMMADARSRDFRAGAALGQAAGPHGEQSSTVRIEQCNCHAAGLRCETENRSRHVHRPLRSPGHSSRDAGRQHLQRRRRQRHRLWHSSGNGACLSLRPRSSRAGPFCLLP